MCGVGWKRQLTINSPTALPNSGLAYAQVTGGTVMAGAQSTLPTRPVAGLLLVHTQRERDLAGATAGLWCAPHPASAHTHQGTRGPGSAPDGQSPGAF